MFLSLLANKCFGNKVCVCGMIYREYGNFVVVAIIYKNKVVQAQTGLGLQKPLQKVELVDTVKTLEGIL